MSRTRTLQQERRYDHIYGVHAALPPHCATAQRWSTVAAVAPADPVYTVAGQRDHYRVLQSSTMSQLVRARPPGHVLSSSPSMFRGAQRCIAC